MSDGSVIADCCGACFGICCLTCTESILVSLNFKKPGGSRAGSTQRGCCRNLGESTEDDVFEENARKERVADSHKKRQRGREGKNGKKSEEEERGDVPVSVPVTEQPDASPTMTAAMTSNEVKPDTDEAK